MLFTQTRSIIRWVRKPLKLGTAKSKLYRVPQRPKLPKEEFDELKRLHNNYKSYMKSILSFIESKYKEKTVEINEQEEAEKFEKEFQERLRINEIWNQKCALVRDERLQKEKEIEIEKAFEKIAKFDENERLRIEKADELVRKEKELSKCYITEDKIDQAIRDAIEHTVDHNFAIDLNGNIYSGRTTVPK